MTSDPIFKTLFVGNNFLFLEKVPSTNDYLKKEIISFKASGGNIGICARTNKWEGTIY